MVQKLKPTESKRVKADLRLSLRKLKGAWVISATMIVIILKQTTQVGYEALRGDDDEATLAKSNAAKTAVCCNEH